MVDNYVQRKECRIAPFGIHLETCWRSQCLTACSALGSSTLSPSNSPNAPRSTHSTRISLTTNAWLPAATSNAWLPSAINAWLSLIAANGLPLATDGLPLAIDGLSLATDGLPSITDGLPPAANVPIALGAGAI